MGKPLERGMKAMKNKILASVCGILLCHFGGGSAVAADEAAQLKGFTSTEKSANLNVGAESKERKPLIERKGGVSNKAGQPGMAARIDQKNATLGKTAKVVATGSVEKSSSSAVGPGTTVNLGNIRIEDVLIKGTVANDATIRNSENIAVGENSTANMGAVAIVGGGVAKSGLVANKTTITSSLNLAKGKGNTANVGTVAASNTRVSGKVESLSQSDAVANIGIGVNNTANMGTINLQNTTIGKSSTLMNTSNSKKSSNIGIGVNNKTSSGSLHIE